MNNQRIGFGEKLAYGFGALTYGIELIIVLDYLMLYCSDVLRIPVAFIGSFMMAVKVLDAVTDLYVMSLADRMNTRWGKYKVWILNGIPLAIVLIIMFSNPSFLVTERAKIVFICVTYCLLVPVFDTALNAPYLALGVTMTEDRQDRLDLANVRALFEAGSAILVSAIVMPVILHFGGYREARGWRYMTYAVGAVIIASSLICFFGTKERIHIDYTRQNKNQISAFEKFGLLKKNAPFWKLVVIIVLYMSQFYASSAIFSYFCIYVLGHEEWVAPLTSIGFGAQIVITLAIFSLGRKFEKRTLLLLACAFYLIADLLLAFTDNYAAAAIYQGLWGIGNGLFNGIAFALIPDVSDYVEWKTGVPLPGVITGVINFILKLGAAFAVYLTGRILVFARYDAALSVQKPFTLLVLRYSLPVFSAICILPAMLITFSLHELSRKKLDEYRQVIDNRQQNKI